MLRYAITDAARTAPDAAARREALRATVRRWSAQGVDFIQLREKSLPAGELFRLAELLLRELAGLGSPARLLINSRADVALAAGAHGVHLTSSPGELTPAQVRHLFAAASRPIPVVSISGHTPGEAARARSGGADLLLFGPVFEKVIGEKVIGEKVAAPGAGLALLREAVEAAGPTPVLALGGVTPANTPACLNAGAAGIAGIRLFA